MNHMYSLLSAISHKLLDVADEMTQEADGTSDATEFQALSYSWWPGENLKVANCFLHI